LLAKSHIELRDVAPYPNAVPGDLDQTARFDCVVNSETLAHVLGRNHHRQLVRESGLKPLLWKSDQGRRPAFRVSPLFTRLPLFGELFANSIHTVLENPRKA